MSPKLPESDVTPEKNPFGGVPFKKFPSRNSLFSDCFLLNSHGIGPRNRLYRIERDDNRGYAEKFVDK